jgi:hypothetical protein
MRRRGRKGAAAVGPRRKRGANSPAIRPFEKWILRWINHNPERGDKPLRNEATARVVARFVRSFDGSEAAGFLQAQIATDIPPQFEPEGTRFEDEAEELSQLQYVLADQLMRLVPSAPRVAKPRLADEMQYLPLRLSFEVGPMRKGAARRVLRVRGPRYDLVLYLVLQLVARSGITLGRCPAPARPPYSYDEDRCGRLFIAYTGRRGQPRTYCVEGGDDCRDLLRKEVKRTETSKRKQWEDS